MDAEENQWQVFLRAHSPWKSPTARFPHFHRLDYCCPQMNPKKPTKGDPASLGKLRPPPGSSLDEKMLAPAYRSSPADITRHTPYAEHVLRPTPATRETHHSPHTLRRTRPTPQHPLPARRITNEPRASASGWSTSPHRTLTTRPPPTPPSIMSQDKPITPWRAYVRSGSF